MQLHARWRTRDQLATEQPCPSGDQNSHDEFTSGAMTYVAFHQCATQFHFDDCLDWRKRCVVIAAAE
jgi:hypothetical protein